MIDTLCNALDRVADAFHPNEYDCRRFNLFVNIPASSPTGIALVWQQEVPAGEDWTLEAIHARQSGGLLAPALYLSTGRNLPPLQMERVPATLQCLPDGVNTPSMPIGSTFHARQNINLIASALFLGFDSLAEVYLQFRAHHHG